MNAKKMGRPKSENPKDIEIRTRITQETYHKIQEYCKNHNINRSDFLRKAIDFVLQKQSE